MSDSPKINDSVAALGEKPFVSIEFFLKFDLYVFSGWSNCLVQDFGDLSEV